MIRRTAAPLALALIVSACHARGGVDEDARVGYRMSLDEVGDTAWYHIQNEGRIGVVGPDADTVIVATSEDYVLKLTATAPDTVIGFFDHIRIMVNRGGRIVPVPMEPLYHQDFVLTDSAGRLRVRVLPHVWQMESSVRETARLLDEMFFTVPAAPLATGLVWVDTVDVRYESGGARFERRNVTRYEVTADTVLHGVPAKTIRYESALDNDAVQLASDSSRTVLSGAETGTIVYAPARRIILSRHRQGRLDGEMLMTAGNTTQRMPHFYEFAVSVDVLPPRTNAEAADTVEAAPVAPRAQ